MDTNQLKYKKSQIHQHTTMQWLIHSMGKVSFILDSGYSTSGGYWELWPHDMLAHDLST